MDNEQMPFWKASLVYLFVLGLLFVGMVLIKL